MAPSLYAADVSLGKPQKVSSARSKKTAAARNEDLSEDATISSTPASDGTAALLIKPKRSMTDETKAKLREARERKKQEKEQAAAAEKAAEEARREAEEAAAALKAAKKEEAARKRRETRQKKKEGGAAPASDTGPAKLLNPEDVAPVIPAPTKRGRKRKAPEPAPEPATPETSSDEAEQEEEEPPKKKRAPRKKKATATPPPTEAEESDDEVAPPQYLVKLVTDTVAEKLEQQGVKSTKKQIRAEGERLAGQKWKEPLTRERIRTTMEGHMGNMYDMIFGQH